MYENMAHALQNAAVITFELDKKFTFLYVDGSDPEQMHEDAEDYCLYANEPDTGEEYAFDYNELVGLRANNNMKIKVLTEAEW